MIRRSRMRSRPASRRPEARHLARLLLLTAFSAMATTSAPAAGFGKVATGLTITPSSPYASVDASHLNFSVNFGLKETLGSSVTFSEVAVAVLDANNTFLFDVG